MAPNSPLTALFDVDVPIIQAPMAGASGQEMALAACRAGALGSLPCALLTPEQVHEQATYVQQHTSNSLNLNFFCHVPEPISEHDESRWRHTLAPYYREFGIGAAQEETAASRKPFDDAMCAVVEALSPRVVSFHFGLPERGLLERVKATGAVVLSSATTVAEARWLEAHGCDVVIAQGAEAGGHRAMFLSTDITRQPGTLALVPQVVDAVDLPVVAAGGIADGRGIAAAFALGAQGVQIGSAYLATPESIISTVHRTAIEHASDDNTALTNLFSGKPARGIVNRLMREIGPMSDATPPFPTAGTALAPLKRLAEDDGSADFSALWAGQATALSASQAALMDTETLTRRFYGDAMNLLGSLGRDD